MDEKVLLNRWNDFFKNYSDNTIIQSQYWAEIKKHYCSSGRHYHNLNHIAALLKTLDRDKDQLADPDVLEWAIWYHDIIYNPLKKNNELKSAEVAKLRMSKLNIAEAKQDRVFQLIMGTANHMHTSADNDYDFQWFLDADLQILGAEAELYDQYVQWIRKEYWMIPGPMYRKGRRSIMLQMLEAHQLYKTEKFKQLYETQARANIKRELALLN